MKQHKHAEVIKAWVDGLPVEVMDGRTGTWTDMAGPDICPITGFDGPGEFRVKPEKTYPVTRMTPKELFEAFDYVEALPPEALSHVANAALRHAIDAGQLVDPSTYMADVRELAGKRNARRDMAIAEAVRQVAKICAGPVTSPEVFMRIDKLNLATIIATVKD